MLFMLVLFVWTIVQNFSFDSWVIKEPSVRKLQFPINLEKGGNVELKDFIVFSSYFKDVPRLELKNEKGADKSQIELLENMTFNHYFQNDCQELNCYQHRTNLSELPSHLWKTLISIEDDRFLDHQGLDIISIARAMVKNIMSLKFKEGGSTLTQQLVKNLFLSSEKTLYRKIKEAIISVYLDSKFDKKQIIEIYLNEVFWGGLEGVKIKGIFAASIYYFNKHPLFLKNYESAILISLLKGPNFLSPLRNPTGLRRRVDFIYKKLLDENQFAKSSLVSWTDKEWENWLSKLKREQGEQQHRCFSEVAQHEDSISYDSYILCVNSKKLVNQLTNRHKEIGWSVKAIIKELNSERFSTFYSKSERDFKKALSEESHSIGSTIKPIIFDILIDLGLNPDENVVLEKAIVKIQSGEWSPKESSKIEWGKQVPIIEILRKSMNNPIINLVQKYEFEKVEEGLKKYLPDIKPLKDYPSEIIGTIEIPVAKLLGIYDEFLHKDCRRMKEGKYSIIEAMSDPNKTTISGQVDKKLSQMKFFGKTGTTNNGQDNWFVFISGDSLGVIWVGNDMNRENKDNKTYGSTTAFQIFQNWAFNRGKRFSDFSCDAVSL